MDACPVKTIRGASFIYVNLAIFVSLFVRNPLVLYNNGPILCHLFQTLALFTSNSRLHVLLHDDFVRLHSFPDCVE